MTSGGNSVSFLVDDCEMLLLHSIQNTSWKWEKSVQT